MTKNRPGRPRLDPSGAQSVTVSYKLTSDAYDRACERASQRRVSLSEVARKALLKFLEDETGGRL